MATDLDAFFKQTIYIVPNNYGYEGYAMIPWLLLFFDCVAVYAPVAHFMKPKFGAFTQTEMRQAIEGREVVPTGFETFFDPNIRSKYYAVYLQAASKFDRELMNSRTALGARASGALLGTSPRSRVPRSPRAPPATRSPHSTKRYAQDTLDRSPRKCNTASLSARTCSEELRLAKGRVSSSLVKTAMLGGQHESF